MLEMTCYGYDAIQASVDKVSAKFEELLLEYIRKPVMVILYGKLLESDDLILLV